jgi:hypothetical protein
MHDYTAWQVHEHRITGFAREADASRLAAIAKAGQTRRHPRAILRHWLLLGLSRLSLAVWRRPADKSADPIAAHR